MVLPGAADCRRITDGDDRGIAAIQALRQGRLCRNDAVMRNRTLVNLLGVLVTTLTLLQATAAQQRTRELETFRNYNRTFQIELPPGWRQIAPGEAVLVSEQPDAPRILRLSSPRQYYGVGSVDAWLAGNFSSPWLYVHEQRDEWHVGDDYAAELRELWRKHGDSNGERHQLRDIHLEHLGTQNVECIVATRTTTSEEQGTPRVSLDVHAPTARQQITLSFTTSPDQFERWTPEFRKWISTLTFARLAQEPSTFADKIGTPLLVGSVIGLILVILYRYTRAMR